MGITVGELDERVRRGIDWLNEFYADDPHWVMKIDLNTLDLASVNSCVLGQLSDAESAGYEFHEKPQIDGELATHLFGFVFDHEVDYSQSAIYHDNCYAALTGLWVHHLKIEIERCKVPSREKDARCEEVTEVLYGRLGKELVGASL